MISEYRDRRRRNWRRLGERTALLGKKSEYKDEDEGFEDGSFEEGYFSLYDCNLEVYDKNQ